MNEYEQLEMRYSGESNSISLDELTLLESVFPDLVVLMNQESTEDVD